MPGQYSVDEVVAFRRKDWLVLYETLYKANASIYAALVAAQPVQNAQEYEKALKRIEDDTLEGVRRAWDTSVNDTEDEYQNRPPFQNTSRYAKKTE